ncbi:hypothetical protein Bhyg_17992, partial [Pseudolycoriella hygida]
MEKSVTFVKDFEVRLDNENKHDSFSKIELNASSDNDHDAAVDSTTPLGDDPCKCFQSISEEIVQNVRGHGFFFKSKVNGEIARRTWIFY